MRALTLQWTSIQSREEKKYFYSVNATEIGDKRLPDASLRPNADFTFEWFSFYRILANYMVWHLIKPLIGELSKPYRDASLELLKVEKGVEAGAPPWKSCVTKTNSVMGFATGYLYIKEQAGKNAKQQVRTWEKFLNTFSRKLEVSFFPPEKDFQHPSTWKMYRESRG